MAVIDINITRDAPASDEPAKLVLPVGKRTGPLALSLLSLIVLSVCATRRVQNVQNWSSLPLSYWLLLFIYADTLLIIVSTTLMSSADVNSSRMVCQTGVFLCLLFYFISKILLYLFLVEKAHLVRGRGKRRLKSKIYWFNCFGMLFPYAGIGITGMIHRIGYIREDGTCIIGIERNALFPLAGFEVIVNLYLTTTFLIPIRNLHSYDNNPRLKKMVFRTFIGSLATLMSTIVNIIVMTVLNGEPAWMCFMFCNCDILFTTLVLHWITVSDSVGNTKDESPRTPGYCENNTNHDSTTKQITSKPTVISKTSHQYSFGVQAATKSRKDRSEMGVEMVDEQSFAMRAVCIEPNI